MRSSKQGEDSGPSPPHSHRIEIMGWITDGYLNGGQHTDRYEPVPQHWLELNRRLGRWGGGQTWRRLEQLGQIAKTDHKE